ncbi:hypothetical protein ABPG72_021733 [Tetrahymena utriculariae]
MDTEVSNHNYTQVVAYLNRATSSCVKKCDSLNNNGTLSSKQESCLKICAENHAIATKIHAEYIRKLAESKYL